MVSTRDEQWKDILNRIASRPIPRQKKLIEQALAVVEALDEYGA